MKSLIIAGLGAMCLAIAASASEPATPEQELDSSLDRFLGLPAPRGKSPGESPAARGVLPDKAAEPMEMRAEVAPVRELAAEAKERLTRVKELLLSAPFLQDKSSRANLEKLRLLGAQPGFRLRPNFFQPCMVIGDDGPNVSYGPISVPPAGPKLVQVAAGEFGPCVAIYRTVKQGPAYLQEFVASGVRIGARYILTAAHVGDDLRGQPFPDETPIGYVKGGLQVSLQGPGAAIIGVHRFARTTPPPCPEVTITDDIEVLELDPATAANLPAPRATLSGATTPPATGVVVASFGTTREEFLHLIATGNLAPAQGVRPLTYGNLARCSGYPGAEFCPQTEFLAGDFLPAFNSVGMSTCFGDSGGGAFACDAQGRLQLIGIVSRAASAKDYPHPHIPGSTVARFCGLGSVFTGVWAYSDWLKQFVQ